MVWRELMAVTLYEADCYRDHCMPIGWHKIDDERFKQRWRESAQGCFDRFNDALKEKSANE